MEVMRQALVQLAKEIEELKFKYIEAERSSNVDNMEAILNELDVLEAYYNHQAAIVNGDNLMGSSQEDVFIRRIQNDTFNTPSSSPVTNTTEFDGFQSRWTKLHDTLKQQKKEYSSTIGFCFICLCDVPEHDLILFSCGHGVCVGECGVRLPTPFCPAPACHTNIEHVFEVYKSKPQPKRKADDESLHARMTDLRARGFVACPAPLNNIQDTTIPLASVNQSVAVVHSADVIEINDEDTDEDNDDVVFLECRKP
jgi:hypothetical protein